MDKMSFGEVLRQTRERKGLELNATARRLRIRPDILRAIEESNFAAMPPRGYARNMVNGYARYLGLNPTEITGMYLDELYAYQVEYETSRMRPTGIDMPSTQSSIRAARRDATRASNRRTFYEREEREAVDEWSTSRSSGRSSTRSRADRLYPESRTHQARGTVLPSNNYTNFYSGPGAMGFLQSNWRSIVIALVGLIVLMLILSQIFSCARKPAEEEVPTVPVTGVSSSDNAVIEQPKAPTSFTFEYSVDKDQVSWIEVYVDGQIQVGEAVEGPQTRSFTSSDSIQFITANPAPVTVKIDGKEVQLEADADGVVNITWNFSDILAQWLADHPGVKAEGAPGANAGTDTGSETAQNASGTGDTASGTTTASTTQDATQTELADSDAGTVTTDNQSGTDGATIPATTAQN